MDGRQKAQLQRVKGTRPIVEELDALRMAFGFDQVHVLTPIVESKLRSGLEPPKALSVAIPLTKVKRQSLISLVLTFQLGYPTIPANLELRSSEGEVPQKLQDLLNEHQASDQLSNIQLVEHLRVASQQEDGDMLSSSITFPLEDEPATGVALDEQMAANDSSGTRCCVYCCKICSTVLFDTSLLHEHSSNDAHSIKCTSYFLEEAPTWLTTTSEDGDKLYCIKCKARVGAWSWAGSQCSCGAWVTPSFQFVRSKLDEKAI